MLTIPALALVNGGLTHAAAPGSVLDGGFAPAMCNRNLWVSVDHVSVSRTEVRDGQRVLTWVTVPERALADTGPIRTADGDVVAEHADCLRCSAAVRRWEAANPDAVTAWNAERLSDTAGDTTDRSST